MGEKQSLSHTRKKKSSKVIDPCPICEEELYHNEYYSKRVGLIDTNNGKLLGWMCSKCNSEFDNEDKVQYIYGQDYDTGKA